MCVCAPAETPVHTGVQVRKQGDPLTVSMRLVSHVSCQPRSSLKDLAEAFAAAAHHIHFL